MKIPVFILSISLLVSCSKQVEVTNEMQTNLQNNFANQKEMVKEQIPIEKSPTPKTQIPFPVIKNFGVYGVLRNSDNVNQHGQQLPPYKEVKIYSIYWKDKPKLNEKVTVIPLNFDFEPFELSIANVTKTTNEYTESCGNNDKEVFWKVELEKLTQRQFFEMKSIDEKRAEEYPFDVFVIYPAVKFARQLKQTELTKQTIPNDSSVSEVSAAVDLTNDGTPDLIEIRYCCSGRNMSPDDPNCDYSDCGELWKKFGNSWKKIHSWSPC
jgi:hypothetical protein